MDADGDNRDNLTGGQGSNGDPDWSPRPEPLPTSYVAMGDSVTQIGSTERYPERFFTFLQTAGAADVLHNIGESGQTSGGLNGSQLTNARALINDPDTDTTVLSIDIGGNDISSSARLRPPRRNRIQSDRLPNNAEPVLDELRRHARWRSTNHWPTTPAPSS